MKYPIAIHKDEDSCYGVTVPDIPGCFSAGDTVDDAVSNAHEAITDHLQVLAEEGIFAPTPSVVEDLIENQDYRDATWFLIDVDVSAFLGKTEKRTVTIPVLVCRRIDALVARKVVKSRSSFLANSAIAELNRLERSVGR